MSGPCEGTGYGMGLTGQEYSSKGQINKAKILLTAIPPRGRWPSGEIGHLCVRLYKERGPEMVPARNMRQVAEFLSSETAQTEYAAFRARSTTVAHRRDLRMADRPGGGRRCPGSTCCIAEDSNGRNETEGNLNGSE